MFLSSSLLSLNSFLSFFVHTASNYRSIFSLHVFLSGRTTCKDGTSSSSFTSSPPPSVFIFSSPFSHLLSFHSSHSYLLPHLKRNKSSTFEPFPPCPIDFPFDFCVVFCPQSFSPCLPGVKSIRKHCAGVLDHFVKMSHKHYLAGCLYLPCTYLPPDQ